jgi:hypothetical protein
MRLDFEFEEFPALVGVLTEHFLIEIGHKPPMRP